MYIVEIKSGVYAIRKKTLFGYRYYDPSDYRWWKRVYFDSKFNSLAEAREGIKAICHNYRVVETHSCREGNV